MLPNNDSDNLCQIHARVTKEAFDLLEAEAARREQEEYRPLPVASLLNEIILKALRPKRPVGRPPKALPPKVQPKPARSTKRLEGKTA